MTTAPRLTLVTVLYGGEDVLRRTLPTWRDSLTAVPLDVVVIDNSPDSRAEQLARTLLPSLELVRQPGNPGFAASANEAIHRSPSDWVLLLNADVFLTAAAIETCLAWIGAPGRDPLRQCAAISLITDGEEYCGVELNAVGYFSDRPARSRRGPLGPSGGAMLIHRDAFLRAGGYDEDLFAWGEDAGLSLRLFACGTTTETLQIGLAHVGGHSVPSLDGLRFKARLLSRNRVRVMRGDWTGPLRGVLGIPQLILIVANGARKAKQGTGRSHFVGLRESLGESRRTPLRLRFGLREFARYRRNQLPASAPSGAV